MLQGQLRLLGSRDVMYGKWFGNYNLLRMCKEKSRKKMAEDITLGTPSFREWYEEETLRGVQFTRQMGTSAVCYPSMLGFPEGIGGFPDLKHFIICCRVSQNMAVRVTCSQQACHSSGPLFRSTESEFQGMMPTIWIFNKRLSTLPPKLPHSHYS